MNILVINASLRPLSPVKLFPIGLGYITTAMKNAGFDFDLLDIDAHRYSDSEIRGFIGRKRYDVVCMGCLVTGYKIIKALASMIKDIHPSSTIIVGNSVATSIAGTLLTRTKCDIAVMGEGDETIVELLSAICDSRLPEKVKGISFIKDNKLIFTGARPHIKDISSLPFIDFSVFDVDIYIEGAKYFVNDPLPIPREDVRGLPINTARGCIANCGFCYHVFKGMPYRYRSAESFAVEAKALIEKYSLNYLMFNDELTFFSKRYAEEFAQRIIDEDLRFYWAANSRADLFTEDNDMPIIRKMKEAGCLGFSYSLESADPEILKAMNKNISLEQFSKQTRLLQRADLSTWTSLVFGYPQETPDTIKKTFDCCVENKIYPSAGYLLPQPGSRMYDYAVKNGFITDEESYLTDMGDRQDLRLNMTRMDDKEFEACVLSGLERCNEELKMGLDKDKLIKTLFYRSPDSSVS